MRRLFPIAAALLWAAACAAPASPPVEAPPAPGPAPSSAPVASSPAPSAPPPPADPPLPPAPVLPFHRFAALVPGQTARLYNVAGRMLLRAGSHLYSLTPGRIHREPALEKALAAPEGGIDFGTIGGHYPDNLVADRRVRQPGKDPVVRQYVRIQRGKVTEMARAKPDLLRYSQGDRTFDLVALPGGRALGLIQTDVAEGGMGGWLDVVPGPKSRVEEDIHGVLGMRFPFPHLLARADGSVLVTQEIENNKLRLFTWTPGAAAPADTRLPVDDNDYVRNLFEATDGVAFLLTAKALYRQASSTWQREDVGPVPIAAWPLPGGAVLLVPEHGEPRVRDARGRLSRASWPSVVLEGRQFPVGFTEVRCSRASGCWAIAEDGAGLYHDQAPPTVVDLDKLPTSAAEAP